jgi:hypothetical protein
MELQQSSSQWLPNQTAGLQTTHVVVKAAQVQIDPEVPLRRCCCFCLTKNMQPRHELHMAAGYDLLISLTIIVYHLMLSYWWGWQGYTTVIVATFGVLMLFAMIMKILLNPSQGGEAPAMFPAASMIFVWYRFVCLVLWVVMTGACMAMFAFAFYKEIKMTESKNLHWFRSVVFWSIPSAWVVCLVLACGQIVSSISARNWLVEARGYKAL